jgi:hypothetical protein
MYLAVDLSVASMTYFAVVCVWARAFSDLQSFTHDPSPLLHYPDSVSHNNIAYINSTQRPAMIRSDTLDAKTAM